MLQESDKRAFDVYLLLLRRHCETKVAIIVSPDKVGGEAISLTFDFDTVADYLGMSKRMNRTAYRRQLTKTLRKLEKRYNLIKFDPKFGRYRSTG